MIYLDTAATSFLKPPGVEEAVCRSFHTLGNAGRGAHAPTLDASRLIYDTRERLASLFHIPDASRISFTCNATEALNIAINGLLQPGGHVITTACEHNSVLRPLYLKEEEGLEVTILSADGKGRIDYDGLEKNRRANTHAVIVTHASNLTGNVTDIKRIKAFTEKYGILLILDASQTAGSIQVHADELDADIICFTGHKGLLGPQGTGGIYVKEGLELPPIKVGGSGIHSFDRHHPLRMPEALEAGTPNGHGIAGLNAALKFIQSTGIDHIHQRENALARRFAEGVGQYPGIILYGDLDAELRAPIISLNIGSVDSAVVSDILWEDYGICVRAGAHCAPLMHKALGTAEQGAVRFSFSYFNTEKEIEQAIQAVCEIAQDTGAVNDERKEDIPDTDFSYNDRSHGF